MSTSDIMIIWTISRQVIHDLHKILCFTGSIGPEYHTNMKMYYKTSCDHILIDIKDWEFFGLWFRSYGCLKVSSNSHGTIYYIFNSVETSRFVPLCLD